MDQPRWSLGRCVVEAGFVGMASLILLDLCAGFLGPIV